MWVRDLPEGAFEFPSTARIMPTPKVRGLMGSLIQHESCDTTRTVSHCELGSLSALEPVR